MSSSSATMAFAGHERPFQLEETGTQWLPVTGFVPVRFLATYRCEASRLSPLVPAPFSLDTLGGFGFVSVCALEVRDMGIRGLPREFRFDNREFLYRLAIRFRGEPTFLTLRSDVSAPGLAWLGRRFSHYRPHLGTFSLHDRDGRVRLACATRSGAGDATFEAAHADHARVSNSVFSSAEHAADFLLGMSFSADATPAGRVRIQRIEHDPWKARFVRMHEARFAFLDRLARELGCRFEYDSTLATHGIRQLWRAAQWA
jgi:hypothetical protein